MLNSSKSNEIHNGSAEMDTEEKAFRDAYPGFNNTSILDKLRATEYALLDEQKHVYLDYTGGALC